jgi:DNA-binding Lrp family transcriptional regulator
MDEDSTQVPRGHLTRLTDDGLDPGSRRPLDDLDELDRRIIVALQHDGRASWTAIAESVGSSVPTVTRRGQQLIDDDIVRVTAMPQLGASGPVDMFFVRITCRPGTQLSVASELAANPDVRFVSLVTGGYDIMAELVVHGGAGNYAQLVQGLQSSPGIERWRSDLVLHVHKVGHDWGSQLFHESMGGPTDSEPREPLACEPSHFDAIDWKLVAELQRDGRQTFKSLGRVLDVNESSARRRLDRLRGNGCIDIVTLVSAAALGFGAETLVTVQVDPAHIAGVAAELAGYSAVRYLASLLDASSLMCEVIATSTDELHRFITGTLASLAGVRGWDAAMELLSLKRGFVETPWWRAQVAAIPAPENRPAGVSARA